MIFCLLSSIFSKEFRKTNKLKPCGYEDIMAKSFEKYSLVNMKMFQLRAQFSEYVCFEGPTDLGFSTASVLPNHITFRKW